MSDRGTEQGSSENEPARAPPDLGTLLSLYKISFVHYSLGWPNEYERLFQDIKSIGYEQYNNFRPTQTSDDLTVAQTKERVFELVKVANADYRSSVNEQTLSVHTEPRVFRRFESEIVW